VKRVVLVRTAGPRNAGMALRATMNFGPCELVLVAPARPSLLVHPEFQQMAHGAEAAVRSIGVVDTLADALADCTRSFGFTARARGSRVRRDWRVARDEVAAADSSGERVALVFGSEESGLTAGESDLVQDLCFLPTSVDHTSINLAMSVGIVLSSIFTEAGAHGHERGTTLAEGADLEYLKAHLKHVFCGQVARGESARRDIEQSIDRIFGRVPVESRDARAWHMMLRALGSRKAPGDFGIEGTPKSRRRKRVLERWQRREDA